MNVPQSPLTLINPTSDFQEVVNSIYSLQLHVVPGSKVLINGEDVTDVVDFEGKLSANINVGYGDNNISILVATANHKQTRKDVVLFREPQDIALEPYINLDKTSSKDTMTIKGTMDASATLVVDTDYVKDSIKVDQDGSFSFKGQVHHHRRQHRHLPRAEAGSDGLGGLGARQLRSLPERVFPESLEDGLQEPAAHLPPVGLGRSSCARAPIVEILQDETPPLVVMNVGTDDAPQYVILDNGSSLASPTVGVTYHRLRGRRGQRQLFLQRRTTAPG